MPKKDDPLQRLLDEQANPSEITIPETRETLAALFEGVGRMERQVAILATKHQSVALTDTSPELAGHHPQCCKDLDAMKLRLEKIRRNAREFAQLLIDYTNDLNGVPDPDGTRSDGFRAAAKKKGYDTG